MTRVVVTGIGAVSACGIGADALWTAAATGTSGVRPVSFETLTNQRVGTAAALSDDDKESITEAAGHRMRDPVAQYALVAAREAISQAGLGEADFGDRCGVVIGSGFGGAKTLDDNYIAFGVEKICASTRWLCRKS